MNSDTVSCQNLIWLTQIFLGNKKPSNNTERAQENERNAASNEAKKHQSDGINEDNAKQSLSNEDVLQQILKGDHSGRFNDFDNHTYNFFSNS